MTAVKKAPKQVRAFLAAAGKKGGTHRAKRLSAERRREIAQNAARARWAKWKKGLERYIRRLRTLERLAVSFTGVAKAFAIQAGPEIRVVVRRTEVKGVQATVLARYLTRKMGGELKQPEQIKVTVMREPRVRSLRRRKPAGS
jgi:HD superfamily phosphodiesterase